MMKQRSAFTLAEVLITLAIIGVVAALTVPQLLTASEDASNLGRFKKVYGELSQSINQIAFENGWYIDTSSHLGFLNELGKKMNFIKTGTWGSISSLPDGFYYKCYKEPNSTNQCAGWKTKPAYNGIPVGVTGSGAFISIRDSSSTCTGLNYRVRLSPFDPVPKPNLCSQIEIDVNGDSPPNMIGKDYFLIALIKEKGQYSLYPSGYGSWVCLLNNPDNYNACLGCSAVALKGGNMP